MAKALIECRKLKLQKDDYYFGIGFASWAFKYKNKNYTLNAIYQEKEMVRNEETNNYLNGIKGFELQNDKYRIVQIFKIPKKTETIDLTEIENWVFANL